MNNSAPNLDQTFAALADPTRRAILARLTLGEASVNELVEPFRLSQPTISRHLQVLTRAGLIERRRDAQFHFCKLDGARMAEAWRWLGGYRQFWEQTFDRLDAFARAELEKENQAEKSRSPQGKREKKNGRK